MDPVEPTESTMPKPAKPDYDQALKRLLLRAHEGFLALIAPGLTWRGELSPELPSVARQADLAWEVEAADAARANLHMELQTKPDETIGERMAEYALRMWRRNHLPVISVVVYLRPVASLPTSPFVITWQGVERMRFTYDSIRLWEIPQERVLESPYYELWPLASLMANVTADSTVEVAQRIAAAPIPQSERNELGSLLISLAGVRLPRVALAEAVRRIIVTLNIWEESSLAGALEDEARRKDIRVFLEARLGPVADDVLDAIDRADENTLMELVRRVATDSMDQIRTYLGLR